MVVQSCHCEKGYSVEELCKLLHIAKSAYYKWATGKKSQRFIENEDIADKIEEIHTKHLDKGYRRINDDLRHDYNIHVNDKRILRICRAKSIKSTIKYSSHSCTRRARNPQYIAENLLARKFHADRPNEKWLTDVTEFKWFDGLAVHKIYLSAILDLYDRRIVSYVISDKNDNPLVFKTFDKAVRKNPEAQPLFHKELLQFWLWTRLFTLIFVTADCQPVLFNSFRKNVEKQLGIFKKSVAEMLHNCRFGLGYTETELRSLWRKLEIQGGSPVPVHRVVADIYPHRVAVMQVRRKILVAVYPSDFAHHTLNIGKGREKLLSESFHRLVYLLRIYRLSRLEPVLIVVMPYAKEELQRLLRKSFTHGLSFHKS